jgi:sulfoquinovosyltransferase
MKIFAASVGLLSLGLVSAFSPIHSQSNGNGNSPSSTSSLFRSNPNTIHQSTSSSSSLSSSITTTTSESNEAPPLTRKPPRKVCLMVEPTPFTHVSGYSNRFNEMLRYMAKAGDKFEILTVDSQTDEKDLPTSKFGYNIAHTQGFTFPLYNHISLTLDLPELKGASILEKFKPDLIHVSSPGFMVFASMFYARVMRIPLLMSYHTHLPSYAANYLPIFPQELVWWLLRFVHSRADLTLCTSPQLQEELSSHGLPRVEVWRKGIDTVRFDPKFKTMEMREKMTDGNPDDFLMVYVGRLGNEKRLMDIKPMLEKMDDNVRLCIVGNGPQAEELHEYFKGTNTIFTGQMSGDDLSSAFASADAFVMPSDSETLGFVVLESMASGVPVVGAAAGGIPNLIHDGEDGYLVPPGDIDGFVDKLNILKDDVETRKKLSKAARVEAERWSWEAATSVLRNIQYEKAIVNFHSRAFNGFGSPGTHYAWRLLKWRIKRILHKLGLTSKPTEPEKQSS